MKKLLAITILGLLSINTYAKDNVGRCVYPKFEIQKNGYQKFKHPITIYSEPNASKVMGTLNKMAGFRISKEANGFVQLTEVQEMDGSNPNAGHVAGWAKMADFDYQEPRNCNF